MPTNYYVVGAASLLGIVISLQEFREALRYRYLRQHGQPIAATIREAVLIPQKNAPLMRLDVDFRPAAGARQQVCLYAPYSDEREDYVVGGTVEVWYDPLRPAVCEVESVVFVPWWKSPFLSGSFLVGASCFFLWETFHFFF